MKYLKKMMNSRLIQFVQCFAFVAAVYVANTSCILIFHQDEMPDQVTRLNKYKMKKCRGELYEDSSDQDHTILK